MRIQSEVIYQVIRNYSNGATVILSANLNLQPQTGVLPVAKDLLEQLKKKIKK